MGKLDYEELAAQSGCIDIACLTPMDVSPESLARSLHDWQDRGNAGALSYVDDRADLLAEPFRTREWAASALVVSFAPETDYSSRIRQLPEAKPDGAAALIAPYALNEDYHVTGERRLLALEENVRNVFGDGQFERCVDSRPVMEKQLARLSGIGIQGMNSLIRNRTHGCRLHLGVLFTSLQLPSHRIVREVEPSCESCRRCLQVCPNHVFGDGGFDVRRCRAWLASEYRRALTAEQQRLLGNTLFGCGLCTSVCPATALEAPRPFCVDPLALLRMPTGELARMIHGTILERTGATVLKRNAAAILANGLDWQAWQTLRPELLAGTASPVVQQTIENAVPQRP